jgi:hypothetical protein
MSKTQTFKSSKISNVSSGFGNINGSNALAMMLASGG